MGSIRRIFGIEGKTISEAFHNGTSGSVQILFADGSQVQIMPRGVPVVPSALTECDVYDTTGRSVAPSDAFRTLAVL